jgi:serine/threonine-protein kinase HipA
MARAAGIEMTECRLLHENGRAHFVTRRFDRTDTGAKLHMQSLCALAHLDFNQAGAHSYEQAMLTMRRLGLPMSSVEEQLRRAAFNVLARNQDDHTKNIAFLMSKSGEWSLSPAFDVIYAHNPDGAWTGRHQMTLHGKRDRFDRSDFDAAGRAVSMKRGRAGHILDEVAAAVARWPELAAEAGVPEETAERIAAAHRRF